MNFNTVLNKVIQMHGTQMRKFAPIPYWTHPVRVASLVMKYNHFNKENSLVYTALLHDVVEDTFYGIDTIEATYGKYIADLVAELTSDPIEVKKQGKSIYLTNKMINMSSEALMIKSCDRLDNISDLLLASAEFISKYGKETEQILDNLVRNRKDLTLIHRTIIDDIYKVMDIYH
jgi:(p)ppGpp synthase/HD superfamily hydrolase